MKEQPMFSPSILSTIVAICKPRLFVLTVGRISLGLAWQVRP